MHIYKQNQSYVSVPSLPIVENTAGSHHDWPAQLKKERLEGLSKSNKAEDITGY